MSNRVVLEIRGDDKASAVLKDFARTFQSSAKQVKDETHSMTSALNVLKGVIVGIGAYRIAKDILQVGVTMDSVERSMKAATGSTQAANESLDFLRKTSDQLGISFQDTVRPFMQLTAAAKGTRLEGEGVRETFLAVAESSAVLGLNASQTERVIYAFQQMISKGKVSAEELRQQLGDQLPGAAQIAARAIGVSTSKFNDMLDSGKILSQDFIPKFVSQLRKEFAEGVQDASDSAQANMNRFNNSMFLLKETVSKDVLPAFVTFLNTVTPMIQEAAEGLGLLLGASEKAALEKRRMEIVDQLHKIEANIASWKQSAQKVGPSLANLVIGNREEWEQKREMLNVQLMLIQEAINRPKGEGPKKGGPAGPEEPVEDKEMARAEEKAQIEQAKAWESLQQKTAMEKFAEKELEDALTKMRYDFLENQVGTTRQALDRQLSDHDVYLQVRQAQIQQETDAELQAIAEKERRQAQGLKNMFRNAQYFFQQMGNERSVAWKAYKAFAVAETIVDTYTAAMAAYKAVAGIKYAGPNLAYAAAGVAVAAGMAKVHAIMNTEPGGTAGGAGGGGFGGGPIGTYPASPTTGLPENIPGGAEERRPTVTFILEGGVISDEEYIEDLMERMSELVEDKDVRLIATRSKN